MTACSAGRDQITCSGREQTKDAAKARVEEAYRALCAANPESRDYVQAHAAGLRWTRAVWERREPAREGGAIRG